MKASVKRYARAIGIRSEKVEEYKALHAGIWPEIAEKMTEFHLQNYSIHLSRFPDGKFYLFSYFEYSGDDFEADMQRLGAQPKAKEWAACCEACQIPLENRPEGEWWLPMEEVFYQ